MLLLLELVIGFFVPKKKNWLLGFNFLVML